MKLVKLIQIFYPYEEKSDAKEYSVEDFPPLYEKRCVEMVRRNVSVIL